MRINPRQRVWIVVLTFLFSISPTGLAEEESSPALFSRIASALERAPAIQRSRFAVIALEHLAEAYSKEAELAAEPAEGPSRVQWTKSVEGYAREIRYLKNRLERGEHAAILTQPLTAPTVVIANYSVMLTHPRPTRQSGFEHRILENFCQQNICNELLAIDSRDVAPEATPTSGKRVNPRWEFTRDGPACTYEGIHVSFHTGIDFDNVRSVCTDLFEDIKTLLEALRWQHEHQVPIDWPHLQLDPVFDSPRFQLRVNAIGDTATIDLTSVHQFPHLVSLITPWLKSRLSSGQYQLRLKAIREEQPDGQGPFTFRQSSG